MTDRGGANERPGRAVGKLGLLQPFEHHDAAPFAQQHAVGILIEAPAMALPGKNAEPIMGDILDGGNQQINRSHQSQITLPPLQGATGLVQGDQGRGGGSVDRQAWPDQPEVVGEAGRCRAGLGAHRQERVHVRPGRW